MEIHLIWAQDINGGIGVNGKLPWHISEDLKNFKKLTLNSTIIMGRKTWDSLPVKPLPKRNNIVLSSTKQKNVITFNTFEDCIDTLKKQKTKKIFIIGGRSIYKLFFNMADYLHISFINIINNETDEFFPFDKIEIDNRFKKKNETALSDIAQYTYWEKK